MPAAAAVNRVSDLLLIGDQAFKEPELRSLLLATPAPLADPAIRDTRQPGLRRD